MPAKFRNHFPSRHGRTRARGFTIIELMIVLSIISILAAIAVMHYEHSVWRAREAVLRNDLFLMRSSIDQYTLDKQKAPQSLDDLVSAGYLKAVPKDPITNEIDWATDQEDTLMAIDQTEPGIVDVHCASTITATDGTVYNTW
ncbi:MAG: prepilin-type N-terminal cleavage/methylation domain-containing protein [Acidobacteriota bacterium]|nr:prepilin-type N-terminal cleavage/methylation domain-containing protein [Acidobacteriota bacterium]